MWSWSLSGTSYPLNLLVTVFLRNLSTPRPEVRTGIQIGKQRTLLTSWVPASSSQISAGTRTVLQIVHAGLRPWQTQTAYWPQLPAGVPASEPVRDLFRLDELVTNITTLIWNETSMIKMEFTSSQLHWLIASNPDVFLGTCSSVCFCAGYWCVCVTLLRDPGGRNIRLVVWL